MWFTKYIVQNVELHIGQTKRQLKTRIKEHKQNVNSKKTDSLTVISEHIFNTGHKIDWENTKILDTGLHDNKRLISECLHIKRHTHSINKKTDTELFPDTYLPILSKFRIDFRFSSPTVFQTLTGSELVVFKKVTRKCVVSWKKDSTVNIV